jgi:hypothetical protein
VGAPRERPARRAARRDAGARHHLAGHRGGADPAAGGLAPGVGGAAPRRRGDAARRRGLAGERPHLVARGAGRREYLGELLGRDHPRAAAVARVGGQGRATGQPARPPHQRALLAAGAELRPLGVDPARPHRGPGRQVRRALPAGRWRHGGAGQRRARPHPPGGGRVGHARVAPRAGHRGHRDRAGPLRHAARADRGGAGSLDPLGEPDRRPHRPLGGRGAPALARGDHGRAGGRRPAGRAVHHGRPLAALDRGHQRLGGAGQQPAVRDGAAEQGGVGNDVQRAGGGDRGRGSGRCRAPREPGARRAGGDARSRIGRAPPGRDAGRDRRGGGRADRGGASRRADGAARGPPGAERPGPPAHRRAARWSCWWRT